MTVRRGAWVIAAAALAILFVGTSPARANSNCRWWEFQNQTFYLTQSNGYVLRITFGKSTREQRFIAFSKDGQITIERQGGVGDFLGPPRFVPSTGSLAFIVSWRPPAGSPKHVNRGTYYGEPRNIRATGDGSLIADLSGNTTGEDIPETTLLDWQFDLREGSLRNESMPSRAGATWNAPARIFCRPENVLLNGQTAKEQDQARQAAAETGPPPKPLGATGGTRPSGPPVAHRLAFTGAWDTTVEGGIGYKLILQPQGSGMSPIGGEMPLEVVGTFIYNRFGDIAVKEGENDNNGSLRGVVGPYARTLIFSYVQRNGKAGSGALTLSDDGQSITGSIENSDGKSAWNGTRAK